MVSLVISQVTRRDALGVQGKVGSRVKEYLLQALVLDIRLHMLLEQLKETESWWAPEQVTCGFFCVGRVGRRPVGWAGAWIYRCFTTTERLKYFKKCLISTRLTLSFGL